MARRTPNRRPRHWMPYRIQLLLSCVTSCSQFPITSISTLESEYGLTDQLNSSHSYGDLSATRKLVCFHPFTSSKGTQLYFNPKPLLENSLTSFKSPTPQQQNLLAALIVDPKIAIWGQGIMDEQIKKARNLQRQRGKKIRPQRKHEDNAEIFERGGKMGLKFVNELSGCDWSITHGLESKTANGQQFGRGMCDDEESFLGRGKIGF